MKLSKKQGPYPTHPKVYYSLLVDDKHFCSVQDKGRGEEIAKRWNEHDILKAQLKAAAEALREIECLTDSEAEALPAIINTLAQNGWREATK